MSDPIVWQLIMRYMFRNAGGGRSYTLALECGHYEYRSESRLPKGDKIRCTECEFQIWKQKKLNATLECEKQS